MNTVVSKASERDITEEMVMAVNNNLIESGLSETTDINFLMDKGYHDSEAIGNLTRKSFNIFIPFHKRKALENSKKLQVLTARSGSMRINAIWNVPVREYLNKTD